MSFITDDFLLKTDTAKRLYNNYAKDMPIIDYHCHINPQEIFEDSLTSITLKGEDGAKRIAAILDDLRQNPVSRIDGVAVKKITDYNNPPAGFVKSNVLHYEFSDGSFVAVRPSGTEPKCKFYYCVCAKDINSAKERFSSFKSVFEKNQ